MTLFLHRATRTDQLADALGELMSVPLADPFADEVIVVPAKGVERWLTQRLSHRLGAASGQDGVCAGVRFLTPYSLVSLLLGREQDDPWNPDRLVWPLLETIDASLDEPWAITLARHLGQDREGEERELRRDRRFSTAMHLARLFGSYAAQRPQLIRDWRAGLDTDGVPGPRGGALAEDLTWQAELWRRLLPRVPADPPDVRHERTLAALRTGDGLELPPRLSLFGHTRLAATEIELLAALGERRDVHLWLPQPSLALWDALGDAERGAGAASGPAVPRADDDSYLRVGHPLLASLGRDARELRRSLAAVAGSTGDSPADPASPEPTAPRTLLGWLQHDLSANAAPGPAERAGRPVAGVGEPGPPAEADRSLQVHACHGTARQIEVLREVLVGLLEDDPTLEPRDILVMCPDIESYAPLISAAFGLAGDPAAELEGGRHPGHRLRVRLADRALSSTNPLLGVAEQLLTLAGGRVTASQVVDLASTPPVRRRFGFTDDELDRVDRWVAEAGVRWGLDAAGREPFAMSRFPGNTWQSGIDRVLLGVAMTEDDDRHLGPGLPLDDVASGEIDLAGRLAELVSRLRVCLTGLDEATVVEDWMDRLREGVLSLTATDDEDAWQVPQFERELARASAGPVDADGESGPASSEGGATLRLADVRALLAHRLAGRPTRANFRTGTLTVCTMTPMRSVPHRVVCLVGLDDGVFPRALATDGDDLLARTPLTGERDPRSEDRQLLLDAVMAATEHLVITYTGASEHSGSVRPPAVPLGEILDAADRTLAEPVRERILTRHPLQPYDARNFKADALEHDPPAWAEPGLGGPRQRPFSFDRAALAGSRAARGPRHEPPPFLGGPLPQRASGDVTLAELKEFLLHPVRSFLRYRLEVATPFEPDEISDAMPVQLDSLEKWQIGDRLLSAVMRGADPQAAMVAEQLRGSLPPGELGTQALSEVVTECQKLWAGTAQFRTGEPRSVDVDVPLGDGRRLIGTVTGVYGSRIFSVGYSRLKPKQRLASWVDLLALSASRPDEHWTALAVGKGRAGPQRALAGPLDHRAADWLRDLVALRDLGLSRPLPAPLATANAWAEARVKELRGADYDPVAAAERAWVTDRFNAFGITGEDADRYHVRVWGEDAPISVLLDDGTGAGGLGEYAWRIWEPLLTGAEKVGPL